MPLEIRIQGFDVSHLGARLLAMARPTYGAVANLCTPGKKGVVFVPTRKQAQLTAIDIVSFAGADARPDTFLHKGPASGEVCFCETGAVSSHSCCVCNSRRTHVLPPFLILDLVILVFVAAGNCVSLDRRGCD